MVPGTAAPLPSVRSTTPRSYRRSVSWRSRRSSTLTERRSPSRCPWRLSPAPARGTGRPRLSLPRMLDLHLELGILRAPPERLDGPGRVGNQLRRISGPSRYHVRGNSTPGYPSRGFQHVFNGCPSAGSAVEPGGCPPPLRDPEP